MLLPLLMPRAVTLMLLVATVAKFFVGVFLMGQHGPLPLLLPLLLVLLALEHSLVCVDRSVTGGGGGRLPVRRAVVGRVLDDAPAGTLGRAEQRPPPLPLLLRVDVVTVLGRRLLRVGSLMLMLLLLLLLRLLEHPR